MLADIGYDNAVFGQTAEQFIQKADGQLRQSPRIKLRAVRPTCHSPPSAPIWQLRVTNFFGKGWNRLRQIADDRQFTGTHSIQLRRINFEVNDLCVRRKARGVARDAVVESRAKHQQQIVFVQRHVGRARSVHADHAQVVR